MTDISERIEAARAAYKARPLTYAEYKDGTPCHACGQPLISDEPFIFMGTMNFTESQRSRYEEEEARFRTQHPDCQLGYWIVSNSLIFHCMACCPPPPSSPQQLASVARLIHAQSNERQRQNTSPKNEIRRRSALIPDNEWHAIQAAAKEQGLDVSTFIRSALRDQLESLDSETSVDTSR